MHPFLPTPPPQADVDVLVEDARKMAVEVEHKVASANVFADQVRGRAGMGAAWVKYSHTPDGLVMQSHLTWRIHGSGPLTMATFLTLRTPTCRYPSLTFQHAQVGVEKEKVAAENDSAKVEADKCAVIAKEVSEKQVGLGPPLFCSPIDTSGFTRCRKSFRGAGHGLER